MEIKERSKNKQFAINLIANIVGFVVNIGIQFLLTPFIVNSLGAAAYGFVGLSNNIITYTQLIAIALNSMASRFITIKYAQGDKVTANKYFSSVFYSNILLACVIGVFLMFCVFYIELVLTVPEDLILDVKLLLGLLSINYIMSLLTNVYSVATFVKNRVDLSSIRNIISNVFRALALIILFSVFSPHIWYIGVVGTLVTIYLALANYTFTKKLTPDLHINISNFDWKRVRELISSGMWNTISQLGTILGQGLDLVIANLFVGATEMGVFSIARQIPFVIIAFSSTIASVFAPSLTSLYALNKTEELTSEIKKSIRLLGLFVIPPLVFIAVFGDSFYSLWVPNQDASFLQLLSILCGLELVFSLPMEACWNVFMITNRMKVSSLFMLGNHLLTFVIVLIGMKMTSNPTFQLVILASTRTILGVIRSLTFLPLYSASCLRLPKNSFYLSIAKCFIAFLISLTICYSIGLLYSPSSWISLILVAVTTMILSLMAEAMIILTKSDRTFFYNKIAKK